MVTEAVVRESLRDDVISKLSGSLEAIYEFWVPRTNERADLAVIGSGMFGFEIKSDRDTLRRLPRQVDAYGRLFDHCTIVAAERHLDAALAVVPEWWGAAVILSYRALPTFRLVRPARPNRSVDPETLVRLLWREEVRSVLKALGAEPDPRASRASMWQQLLGVADLDGLKHAVREALLGRDHSLAHFPSRRSMSVEVRQ
jgi:hypothetical protein